MSLFMDGAVLVFGGSGGMGSAIATIMARDGSDVAICYRNNQDAAQKVADDVAALGVKASIHAGDIGTPADIEKIFAEAIKAHGRIHTVVITAGSDIAQPLLNEVTEDQWREVIDNDLNGAFKIIRTALPHFTQMGGGSFVHLSSAGILKTPPRDVLSVAPKMAIEGLIKYVAKEEGVNNIRANSIALGVIEAGIFKRLQAQGVFDAAWEEAVLAGLALKRFGDPVEVAETVSFLASNRAGYITGQLIAVDGGFHL